MSWWLIKSSKEQSKVSYRNESTNKTSISGIPFKFVSAICAVLVRTLNLILTSFSGGGRKTRSWRLWNFQGRYALKPIKSTTLLFYKEYQPYLPSFKGLVAVYRVHLQGPSLAAKQRQDTKVWKVLLCRRGKSITANYRTPMLLNLQKRQLRMRKVVWEPVVGEVHSICDDIHFWRLVLAEEASEWVLWFRHLRKSAGTHL